MRPIKTADDYRDRKLSRPGHYTFRHSKHPVDRGNRYHDQRVLLRVLDANASLMTTGAKRARGLIASAVKHPELWHHMPGGWQVALKRVLSELRRADYDRRIAGGESKWTAVFRSYHAYQYGGPFCPLGRPDDWP